MFTASNSILITTMTIIEKVRKHHLNVFVKTCSLLLRYIFQQRHVFKNLLKFTPLQAYTE